MFIKQNNSMNTKNSFMTSVLKKNSDVVTLVITKRRYSQVWLETKYEIRFY